MSERGVARFGSCHRCSSWAAELVPLILLAGPKRTLPWMGKISPDGVGPPTASSTILPAYTGA